MNLRLVLVVGALIFSVASPRSADAQAAVKGAGSLWKFLKGSAKASKAIPDIPNAQPLRLAPKKPVAMPPSVKPKTQGANLGWLFGSEKEKGNPKLEKRDNPFGGFDLYDKNGKWVQHVSE